MKHRYSLAFALAAAMALCAAPSWAGSATAQDNTIKVKQYQDNTVLAASDVCDAKPAPFKPGKMPAPGKGGNKKKCVTANVPLDDGYMYAKFAKKAKASKAAKAKPPKTT